MSMWMQYCCKKIHHITSNLLNARSAHVLHESIYGLCGHEREIERTMCRSDRLWNCARSASMMEIVTARENMSVSTVTRPIMIISGCTTTTHQKTAFSKELLTLDSLTRLVGCVESDRWIQQCRLRIQQCSGYGKNMSSQATVTVIHVIVPVITMHHSRMMFSQPVLLF